MDSVQPKLRVFAGPNGSGKSTVIDFIRNYKVNEKNVEFGYYINADDIAKELKTKSGFSFNQYNFKVQSAEFNKIVSASGLINDQFTLNRLIKAYSITNNSIHCTQFDEIERLAQIVADYLRRKLLKEQKRFSFETVFSHSSKLDIMQDAVNAGYKVYLYFVCTESAEINKFRVEARMKKGGHSVPIDKIEKRYYKALNLLHDASQLAHQAFFFDNSEEGVDFKMFAHFKIISGKKAWDDINDDDVPNWFKIYYSDKITK
ncbi:toxin [Inquilinus sp. KBS0705]|nr:toxin [Inquilinus sp. KBS0705]